MEQERKPDYAFEALVRATGSNPRFERGRLNAALKAIKEAARDDGLLDDDLPKEIELRAAAYRRVWPSLTLTPTALARHWYRVVNGENPDTAAQALTIWMERYR